MTIMLETERLALRQPSPDDVDAHAAMLAHHGYAATMTLDGKPQSRAEAWRIFASVLGHWTMRGYGFFSVFERESGDWIGRVGPWMPEGWPGLECGWSIAPTHWGKGYAAEAAVAATRWIFERQPDLPRIISLIAPTNEKSQAVARKFGERKTDETFVYAPTLTLDIWAAGRDEWLQKFGRG